MRRSVLAVAGTLAGVALMVGAKLGTTPSSAATIATTTDVNGTGIAPAFAPPPSAPMTNAGAGAAAQAPMAAPAGSSAPETGDQANGAMNPAPPAGNMTMPPQAPGGAKDGTYTGSAAVQRYGYTVSVAITVAGGRITAATGTCDNVVGESQRYCMGAMRVLQQETLAAQSANVATVSGATYSSAAYRTSLQAALDKV